MHKIRKFEINKIHNRNQYVVMVDGISKKMVWKNSTISDFNEYNYGDDMEDEIISTILQELNKVYFLSEAEQQKYKRSLEYILKD